MTADSRKTKQQLLADLAELRQSEAKLSQYARMLDEVNDAVLASDEHFRLLFWNKSAERIYGWRADEVLGKRGEEILKSEFISISRDEALRLLAEKGEFRGEMMQYRKDGSTLVVEAFASAIRSDEGKVTGFISINRDITDRKRIEALLKESEDSFHQLSDATFEAIAIHDKGVILHANRAFTMMFGYELPEVIGKNALDFAAPESRDLVMKNIISGYEKPYEAVGLRKDGSTFIGELLGRPIEYKGRQLRATAIRDITERKRAEETLRESEEWFSKAFHRNPMAMTIASLPEGRLVNVNDSFLRLFEYTREALIGHTSAELSMYADPEERAQMRRIFSKEGQVQNVETTARTRTGKLLTVLVSAEIFHFRSENHVISMVIDITARKRAEAALMESEERFLKAFHSSPVGLTIASLPEGRWVDVNDTFLRMVEYSREEVLWHTSAELNMLPNPGERAQILRTFLKRGNIQDRELIVRTKTGKLLTVLSSSEMIALKGKEYAISTLVDVTKRKEAEDALEASETKYRTLLENLPQKIFLKDRYSVYISCNDNYARDLKIQPGEIAGKTDYDFFPGELADKYRADDKRIIESGRIEDIEEQYIQDGRKRFVHTVKTVVRDESGNAAGILGIFWDITERKLAEEALRESEERYRNLVATSPDGIVSIGRNGLVTFASKKAVDMLGCEDAREIVGHPPMVWIAPDDRDRASKRLSESLAGNYVGPNVYRMSKKDGTLFWAETDHAILRDDAGSPTGIIAVIRDITRRMQAEEALKHSREELRDLVKRLQTIREEERTTVAREIHDELGQSLTALHIDLSWLTKHLPRGDRLLMEKAERMIQLLNATSQAVQRLAESLRPAILDDFGLIAAMEWQVADFRKRTDIKCHLRVSDKIPTPDIEVATAIFRILQEALTNVARHSGATGVRVSLKIQKGGLALQISDNGRGITQKEISNPKSFGLIGMRERAESFSGNLRIIGIPGEGTTIQVSIPPGKRDETR